MVPSNSRLNHTVQLSRTQSTFSKVTSKGEAHDAGKHLRFKKSQEAKNNPKINILCKK